MSFRATAFRAPPPLTAATERRMLKRLPNEESSDAVARASSMPWWRNVVNRRPANARGLWIWTVRTT